MVKFNASNNNFRAEGGKALGDALKGNQVLQELNIASNMLIVKADAKSAADTDMSGVIAIGDAIPTMGALTSLNVSNNSIGQYWDRSKMKWISEMTGVQALAAAAKCK